MGEVHRNLVRERLAAGQWVATVEYMTPEASEPLEEAIAPILELARGIEDDPRVAAIALTDRVKSENDHDPVEVGIRVAEASGKTPVVHLAGKDRGPAWLEDALRRARAHGLENLLLVTGDRVRDEPPGRRIRYYDSASMIAAARATGGDFLIAAAVSPFKYREEELMNQYLRMAKKELAGADLFIAQMGWDMLKLKEMAAYRRRRGLRAPVMGSVMLLTVARARFIREHAIAGIVITGPLHALLEREATAPDRGRGAAYRRLALQVVGLRRLGYAGFQVTGIHRHDTLRRVLQEVETVEAEVPTEDAWWDAWWDAIRGPDGRPVPTAPRPFHLYQELQEPEGWRLPLDRLTPVELPPADTGSAEFATFRRLDRLHRAIFRAGSPGARVLGPLARLVPRGSVVDRGLHWIEQRIEGRLLGCQACGLCRIPYTLAVCPETCPKGLDSGACGGTVDNRCEFGDRECIHNARYRIAKAAGRLEELESVLIPTVEEGPRGTCSWASHFRGEDPHVVHLGGSNRDTSMRRGGV